MNERTPLSAPDVPLNFDPRSPVQMSRSPVLLSKTPSATSCEKHKPYEYESPTKIKCISVFLDHRESSQSTLLSTPLFFDRLEHDDDEDDENNRNGIFEFKQTTTPHETYQLTKKALKECKNKNLTLQNEIRSQSQNSLQSQSSTQEEEEEDSSIKSPQLIGHPTEKAVDQQNDKKPPIQLTPLALAFAGSNLSSPLSSPFSPDSIQNVNLFPSSPSSPRQHSHSMRYPSKFRRKSQPCFSQSYDDHSLRQKRKYLSDSILSPSDSKLRSFDNPLTKSTSLTALHEGWSEDREPQSRSSGRTSPLREYNKLNPNSLKRTEVKQEKSPVKRAAYSKENEDSL